MQKGKQIIQILKQNKMYIVIETFDKTYPSIVSDENGMPIIFKTEKQAKKEVENLQDGIIVEI